MTTSDRAHDELASAYLDDEATPDERARVEGDPALQARVAALASGRDRVREVTPLTDDQRDELLTTVFRRLDQPTALAPHRDRRRFDPSSLVAAAAAVIALGLFGGALTLLGTGGGNDSDDSASAPTEAVTLGDGDASAGDSAAGAESAIEPGTDQDGSGAFSTSAPAGATDLGAFGSLDVLAATVRREDTQRSADDATSPSTAYAEAESDQPSDHSEELARCAVTGDDRVYLATVEGRELLVIVPSDATAPVVTVLDRTTCAIVGTFAR